MAQNLRYFPKTSDGWLTCYFEPGGVKVSFPYGLKVAYLETVEGFEVCEVLEGVYKNKKIKIRLGRGGASHLLDDIAHGPAGAVQFNLDQQSLTFGGMGPYNAFSGGGHAGFTPVPRGMYQLAIPAFPSSQTRREYSVWTPFHATWFRIGLDVSRDRFLHCGEISDGCVTVRQFIFNPASHVPPPNGFGDLPRAAVSAPGLIGLPLAKKPAPVVSWTHIYEYLILRRASDQSVGSLVVS